MKTYTLSRLAEEDIRSIWKYSLEKWGESLAVDYLTGLGKRLQQLSESPDTYGIPRPDIKLDYMSSIYQNHIIFFKKRKDTIKVIRVLHQRMDLPQRKV